MTKDLKILPKERREEILNSRIYLDIDPEDNDKLVLVIDKDHPKKI